jgi:putative transposase
LAACPRPTARYVARKRSDEELAMQLQSLAADDKSRSHGYRKYTWLLRRDCDLVVNHKRVYRVYSALDLTLPKASRRLPSVRGVMPPPVTQLNERWSVDFVKDRLVRGRQFRVFDVVEDFTSESMAIEADFSLPSLRVIEVFERLIRQRGTPAVLRFDNVLH